ncbi:conserved hypothetical protein [Rhodococcus sp. RD6.2]|uniref:DUF3040 domain-containing protein n=1 Tax=unclassified Rhodococcus (in: high G+C Gram-positive bacteria) TaxID=192944 RepID=UPI00063B8A8A|nr:MULTISPECIES: DUF3040 domain-containing protein [unclassified Rhodococcus (in: high G+C Gram-positive bacteria)]CRK51875.1 conserved hypothetical protein [Rhodococcus sp. RD6.2]
MPLSEHEQRMLDQIESALYAEDPKFASSVRGGRMRAASSKRRMQAGALFVLGLILLVAGIPLAAKAGAFLIISLLGFLVMFGAGVLFLRGSGAAVKAGSGEKSGSATAASKPSGGRKGGGFSSRMEDRFKKRFEQE